MDRWVLIRRAWGSIVRAAAELDAERFADGVELRQHFRLAAAHFKKQASVVLDSDWQVRMPMSGGYRELQKAFDHPSHQWLCLSKAVAGIQQTHKVIEICCDFRMI